MSEYSASLYVTSKDARIAELEAELAWLRKEYRIAQEALSECVCLWFDAADIDECDEQILRFNDITAGLRVFATPKDKA